MYERRLSGYEGRTQAAHPKRGHRSHAENRGHPFAFECQSEPRDRLLLLLLLPSDRRSAEYPSFARLPI